MDEQRVVLSAGEHDAPEQYCELADALNATPDQHEPQWTDVGYTVPTEELSVVVGEYGVDGKIHVNEKGVEPGRYRVRAGAFGEIIGEITVTDPVTHFKSNRADRRRQGQRGNGVVRRRDLYSARWGRD